jgi:hypothetical protein
VGTLRTHNTNAKLRSLDKLQKTGNFVKRFYSNFHHIAKQIFI